MHDFIRILNYSNNLKARIIKFFVFSIIGTIFSALSLVVVIPMLEILFDKVKVIATPALPPFSLTTEYITGVFQHYFFQVINDQGKINALLFICIAVVSSVLLGNIFGYIERIVASKMRVDIVRNLRNEIFEKVTLLHLGFFNNQRKGDLISRFTNDVQEVEGAVVNSLKVVLKEPIKIIVYFSLLFTISLKLTLFTIVVLPLVGGALAEIVKRLRRQAKQSQESLGRTVNVLDETFGGMRVVKAFNARNYILKKMRTENDNYSKVNLSMAYKN
jgi:subfamily B ATP-binding cassette protein MsbA